MRRWTSIIFASAVLLAGYLLAGHPAIASAADPASLSGMKLSTTLITGVDRYDTAIRVSQAGFPGTAPAVVITRGDSYPDALCAGPLAHAYGGPLLLTPANGLTPNVKAELQRLDPQEVLLVGLGNSSTTIAKQVSAALPNSRQIYLTGRDRYETAAVVAKALTAKTGVPDKIVVAPGDSFPDALAVAPLAAAKGWPILYTPQRGALPPVTRSALGSLGATSVLEVGTHTPVGPANVTEIVGQDRYETSLRIAEYASTSGLDTGHVAFARGDNYPDGIASGPYLALDGGILLLTSNVQVPSSTEAFLTSNGESLQQLDAIGLASMPRGPWLDKRDSGTSPTNPGATTDANPTQPPAAASTPTTPVPAPTTRPTTSPNTSTPTTAPSTTTTTNLVSNQVSATNSTLPATDTATTTWYQITYWPWYGWRSTTSTTQRIIPTPSSTTTSTATYSPPTATTSTTTRSTTTTDPPTTTTLRPTTTTSATAPPTTTSAPPTTTTTTAGTAIPLSPGMALQSGKTYTGSISGSGDYGAWAEGAGNVTLAGVSSSGFRYGVAIWGGQGLRVDGYIGHNDRAPFYASHLVDSELDGLDLESDSTSTLDHAIYLSAGNSNISGHNWRLVGGAGYALHLYCEDGSGTSSGLDVNGLYMDGRAGLYPAVIHNWSNVRLSNVTSYSNRAHYSLWNTSDVLIENFEAWGGTSLVYQPSGYMARNVIFRNGVYHGSQLTPDGKPIPGVTFENVTLVN